MTKEKFIDIKGLIESKNPKLIHWLPGFVISYLRRVLHEDEINQFLRENEAYQDIDFCESVLNYLNIRVNIHGIDQIPKDGPVILAMNHPLGGMDAIGLIVALRHQRNDLKFIVNDLLMNLKNLRGLFIGVNKHGKNDLSVRDQIKNAFSSENAICIFPAGLVSRKIDGVVQDLEWKKTFVVYSRELNRTIVPIHIEGELSPFFYRISKFRKWLGIKANIEMFWLSDELFRQRNKTINITVGSPILGAELNSELNDYEAAQYIRKIVYSLRK
ncbi:MAG: 1-acyl-sn-glycerol-3-phosphate acyltransferase [Bacteroidetes bacterium]|nr:1-acyl-sn-glycerol-3-phosphate acyltransferase [Bacteroidota bacterium]